MPFLDAHTLQQRHPALHLALLRTAHALVLKRLALEAALARAAGPLRRALGRPAVPRVAVTACWRFPIYSQTFVQQEAAALARSGVALRFFHAETGPRSELAHPCALLWGLRRRLVLHRLTGALDLAHYRARQPETVARLLQQLSAASGLALPELLAHEHVLHAFSFARAAQAWRAHYLHSYFFYEQSLFVWVAAQLLGLPRGISCYADHLLHDYALKLVPLQLQGSAVLVATSRRIAAELVAINGAPLPAVLVKPNAVDTRSFAPRLPAPSTANASGAPLRVLSVCRIDPKKGLEHLVDAIALLRGQGRAVQLRVVGAADQANGEAQAYATAVQARAAGAGLGDAVQWLGQRDSLQIRAELQAADVFVAPYVELANGDKDGIPTAVLEAMAAGCAIVATDAGSIPEILEPDVQALRVPQRDAAALAQALARLADEPALAQALGQAAAQRARAEFDIVDCERPFHAAVRAAIQAAAAAPQGGPRAAQERSAAPLAGGTSGRG